MAHTPRQRLDTSVPHPARVWDYWLGGTENFAPDREVGDQITAVCPELPIIARAERQFIGRTVTLLAGELGVDQFLDIGTGIPTEGNTHLVAQKVNPAARVVYVDNDPLVLVHARALLDSTPQGATDYIDADLRNPDPILQAASDTLDFARPIGLMLIGVLDFVVDDTLAIDAVNALVAGLAPGSYLAIASSTPSEAMDKAADVWHAGGGAPIVLRSPERLARFFQGLELLDPGVVTLPEWRPDAATDYIGREVCQYGGVGRKP
ncbi:SAM-dependent methyltransferase [Herbidospora sp. NEAU-GS84]|uniref:SAM-dependent methyltransferase n=1 Tax=Herbidospora solisilvae TaxID=2696284 RepID=A0A7C9NRW5_9ACTN|nr:SAM-dependent methyltransferase [Herbidospora solisilvae]NAS25876.1 SAM-dependent methyltransferase [Herbidospora solisilvae]